MAGLGVMSPRGFDLVIALVHQLQIAQTAFVDLFDAFDVALQELVAGSQPQCCQMEPST
jgi:hypothetical protein